MSIHSFLNINTEIPFYLRDWLSYSDSLTDRLQARAGDAQLRLLSHAWGPRSWWDQYVLDISDDQVIHREIMMYAHSEACWYARTIIPKQGYASDPPFFNRLQKESLGALIYDEPRIQRVNMEPYAINDQCIEYHWLSPFLCDLPSVLWGRLSELRFNTAFPFYLMEIMLPPLQRYSN